MICVDTAVVLAQLLATIEFLRAQGQRRSLATYDRRMAEAAFAALQIPLTDPAQA